MSEKIGEVVRATGDYRCERCHKTTHFVRDDVVPKCPHCGFDTFDIANARFETKDGKLGPHEPEPDGSSSPHAAPASPLTHGTRMTIRTDLKPNTFEYEMPPLITPSRLSSYFHEL